ncbi:MAG: substrate-binding domain-containing protein, partial [Planctomycetes bacterium]|nr:substrate-binding domain-containing protein [Planctomycetota bacterium]
MMTRWVQSWLMVLAFAGIVYGQPASAPAGGTPSPDVLATTTAGRSLVEDLIIGFSAAGKGTGDLKSRGTLRWFAFEEFAAGQCSGLLHTAASDADKQTMKRRLGQAAVREVPLGELRLLSVVNSGNPVSQISLEGIGLLLKEAEKPALWNVAGGAERKVTCYVESENSISREIAQWKCLTWRSKTGGGRHPYRKDAVTCAGPAEILRKVVADPSGLGLFLYDPNDEELRKLLTRVKVLKVGTAADAAFVEPSLDPVFQSDYPLSESVVLFLHPKAPPVLSEFTDFCVSLSGAEIAEKHGLITRRREVQYEGERRLVQAKAGKGTRLAALGVEAGRSAVPNFASEFIRAKEVVQLSYASENSDLSAVGAFLSRDAGGKELLLLADKPSERAMQAHGQKWNDLQPAEHMLAGRAVAIIVNPTSKLESLSLDQVRGIFAGETTDWSVLAGPKGPIHCLGLPNTDPAARIFYAEGLPAERLKKVATKKDTAEAVAAVSMDAGAIAFVDLAAIPATGQTVKVL